MLERLSANAEHAAPRILDGHDALQGAVVVATCNRFEAYLDLDAAEGDSPVTAVHEAIRAVGTVAGLEPDELRTTFGFVHGNAVAGHLFAVASGLESVVVGEGEIAGQVRRSLERARTEGTTTPELERLFQRASQTSRRVKNETGIGSEGRSLVRLALDLAESRITDWAADARAARRHRPLRGRLARRAPRPRRHRCARLLPLGPRGEVRGQPRHRGGRARRVRRCRPPSADSSSTCTTAEHHVVDRALIAAGASELRGIRRRAAGVARRRAPEPARQRAPARDRPRPAPQRRARRRRGARRRTARPRDDQDPRAARGVRGHGCRARDRRPRRPRLRRHRRGARPRARRRRAAASTSSTSSTREIERARARGDDDGRTEAALRHMAGVLLHTPMVRSRELARAGEQAAWIDGLEALFGVKPDEAACRCAPGRRRMPARCASGDARDGASPATARLVTHERGLDLGRGRTRRRGRRRRSARAAVPVRRDRARPTTPLRTERLVLRPLEASDAADVYEYQRLPEVIRYLPWPERDRAEGYEHTAKRAAGRVLAADGDFFVLAVTLPGTPVDRRPARATASSATSWCASRACKHAQLELGWVLHPDFQGTGYAREAAGAVLDFVFETLNPHRVQAFLDARNAASAALCERLGMRREATLLEEEYNDGEWQDTARLRRAAPRVGGPPRRGVGGRRSAPGSTDSVRDHPRHPDLSTGSPQSVEHSFECRAARGTHEHGPITRGAFPTSPPSPAMLGGPGHSSALFSSLDDASLIDSVEEITRLAHEVERCAGPRGSRGRPGARASRFGVRGLAQRAGHASTGHLLQSITRASKRETTALIAVGRHDRRRRMPRPNSMRAVEEDPELADSIPLYRSLVRRARSRRGKWCSDRRGGRCPSQRDSATRAAMPTRHCWRRAVPCTHRDGASSRMPTPHVESARQARDRIDAAGVAARASVSSATISSGGSG